ncbi:MAG: 4-hydroxythreonine-4-phosphate dehydrogenase PdxA [Planctomycetota bacterium]
MGDPCGIGPEVVVRSLADEKIRSLAQFRVYGFSEPMVRAAELIGVEPFWWRVGEGGTAALAAADSGVHRVMLIEPEVKLPSSLDCDARRSTAAGGEASFQFVESALAAAMRPQDDPLAVDGVVTAPISKAAWHLAGRGRWPGHTELVSSRMNAKNTRMMFVAPRLRVMLVTAHIPLYEIRNVLTIGRVHDTISLADEACRSLGVASPRIAVCGLNPHAGEDGLMGDEEKRLVAPAISLAQSQGVDVQGPFPGDTIFNAAVNGRYDIVIAMYHDQGLIPVKLLAFDSAVNMTAGLPRIRTSPDHGTAFDIAWQGKADAGSMSAAIRLAAQAARTAKSGGSIKEGGPMSRTSAQKS